MTTPPPPPGQDPYQQEPAAYPQPPAYPQYPQPPTYQVSGPPQHPVSGGATPYSPYPGGYGGYPPPPMSPGFDPMSGRPYSDKSKLAAGLLQLLPGFFLFLGGIGRLYAGQAGIGVGQLVLSGLTYLSFCCAGVTLGLALVVAIPLAAAAWLWAVIDGIVLLAGTPVDGQGRPLRP